MKTRSIDAVLLDLDETLVASDLSISDQNRATLRQAQESGVRIILASGRPLASVAKLAEELPVEPVVVASNGGCVVDILKKKILLSHPMDTRTIAEVTGIAYANGASPSVISPTEWFVERIDQNIELEIERSSTSPTVMAFDRLSPPLIKVLIVGEKEPLLKCEAELERWSNDAINWFYTYPEYLEVMPAGVSKGKASGFLLNHLDISPNKVMAIGDGVNDVDMLKSVGTSVAVANAAETTLQIADFITLSNDDDGVSVAINALVFNEAVSLAKLVKNESQTHSTFNSSRAATQVRDDAGRP
jgi:Cof subfamily protein (haloacid dehalogenase superfamily)